MRSWFHGAAPGLGASGVVMSPNSLTYATLKSTLLSRRPCQGLG
jgi:hypothetical protein